MGKWLEFGTSNYRAYRAVPESGSGPGVLVLHAWWGLTSVFTDVCDRLAAAGFVALAPDLYANGATTASIDEAERLMQDHEGEPIVLAAIEALRGLPEVTAKRIVVIGFSLGGNWALHASIERPGDIGAVVTFYGTGGGDFSKASAAYLGHFADYDAFEPLEEVRALESAIREAGRDVTFHIYPNTGHWFAEPNRPDVYNSSAADLVWDRTLAFLKTWLS